MSVSGKLFYNWSDKDFDESLKFNDAAQLGDIPYDVAIIGAGVVGCALAYKLSMYKLRVLLLDKNYDVGEATSKGNSAIVHTGFDAAVGTLESELVTKASREWPELAKKLKIPYDECGALLLFFFNDLASVHSSLVSAGLLFSVGFLIYGPDSLVSATAAVDFGTRKGASTASGVINGMGSIGAIAGGTIPGFFKESWGWDGVFMFLSASVLIASLLMISKWNALPGKIEKDKI